MTFSWAIGSNGAIQGAKMAITYSRTSVTRPTSASLLFLKCRTAICHCDSPISSLVSGSSATAGIGLGCPLSGSPGPSTVRGSRSVIANPRVDDGVQHICDQVTEHDHHGEHEARGHDQRIIPLEDRIHDDAAHA